jgi:hypothetical protein
LVSKMIHTPPSPRSYKCFVMRFNKYGEIEKDWKAKEL